MEHLERWVLGCLFLMSSSVPRHNNSMTLTNSSKPSNEMQERLWLSMPTKSALLYRIRLISSARQAEIDAMSKGDIFKSFYAQLEEIQNYHKKFPDMVERPVGSSSFA